MITFEALQERSLRHYRTVHIENKEGLKDPSCVICYPPEGTSEEFDKFWDWYEKRISTATYSEYTIRIFKDLLSLEISEKSRKRDTKLLNLIGSIKCTEKPKLTIVEISTKIIEIFVCSKYFELSIEQAEENLEKIKGELSESSSENKESPEQTEAEKEELFDTGIEYEIEKTLQELESINTEPEDSSVEDSESESSKKTTELISTEDLELKSETGISETESESSEYNLNLLFEENLVDMAGITDAQFQTRMEAIFGAHGENVRPVRKINEFSGRDDEDPHEWCAEFEKACAANGWGGNDNNVRRKNIAATYLRGNAAEWYETDQANIVQWHIDGQNDNFRERFKDHFSPQSKQIKWQVELTNIKQGIEESIEDYAKRFKKIMRKVNYTNALAAGVQVNYFIKGLNPLYITQVMMTAPANLNAAVTQAKLLETGTQIAGLSVFGNTDQTEQNREGVRNNKPKRNTFMREKDVKGDAMDELIEKFDKMALKLANIEKGKTSRNNSNQGIKCYNCNRTGHFARDCNVQRNERQNMGIKTCNTCGKTGHISRECYRNKICQRCDRKGHTQEICRSTISRLNYVDEEYEEESYDNNNEFYENEDDEAYLTLRSGKKTHVPEIARRLQAQGHQRPEPAIIQQEQEQRQSQPRKIVKGRKKMNIDGEGEYETKRTRGKAQVDNVRPYDMIDIIKNVQAPVSIAQLLKDPKNQKELREFLKRTSHMELAEADEEY